MTSFLTLEAFAEWCEKQPADGRYDPADPYNCAATQFIRAIEPRCVISGWGDYIAYRGWWPFRRAVRFETPVNLLRGGGVFEHPHTFGALAKRLREA